MRRYVIVAIGLLVAVAPVLVAAPASAATVKVSTKVSATSFRSGESIWLTGTVHKGSKIWAGATIGLRAQKAGSTAWTVLATTKTSSSGTYSFPVKPTAVTTRFYVRAGSTSSTVATRSPIVTARYTVGARTLEDRAKLLGSRLGSSKSGTSHFSSSSTLADKAVTSVRYRNYTKGMLVEVRRSGALRTWFVPGKIRDRLVKEGGVRGKFGVPRADATCTLIESGCTQQFSKVAAYASATTAKAHYQAGTTKRAQYIATARSQVGYKEPSWRNSKYNAWIGAHNAWCSVFQSWVAAASGNPGAVPKRTTYDGFVAAVKKNLLTYKPGSKTHKPRAGTLAIFAFRNGEPNTPSHVGLVLSVSGSRVTVLEGNSSTTPVFNDHRGVYIHKRYLSSVVFYAEPDY
ncbi:MAG: CHAP domain-containing protein [Brevundimonas sp.]